MRSHWRNYNYFFFTKKMGFTKKNGFYKKMINLVIINSTMNKLVSNNIIFSDSLNCANGHLSLVEDGIDLKNFKEGLKKIRIGYAIDNDIKITNAYELINAFDMSSGITLRYSSKKSLFELLMMIKNKSILISMYQLAIKSCIEVISLGYFVVSMVLLDFIYSRNFNGLDNFVKNFSVNFSIYKLQFTIFMGSETFDSDKKEDVEFVTRLYCENYINKSTFCSAILKSSESSKFVLCLSKIDNRFKIVDFLNKIYTSTLKNDPILYKMFKDIVHTILDNLKNNVMADRNEVGYAKWIIRYYEKICLWECETIDDNMIETICDKMKHVISFDKVELEEDGMSFSYIHDPNDNISFHYYDDFSICHAIMKMRA